jgi:hypothetical protein
MKPFTLKEAAALHARNSAPSARAQWGQLVSFVVVLLGLAILFGLVYIPAHFIIKYW